MQKSFGYVRKHTFHAVDIIKELSISGSQLSINDIMWAVLVKELPGEAPDLVTKTHNATEQHLLCFVIMFWAEEGGTERIQFGVTTTCPLAP